MILTDLPRLTKRDDRAESNINATEPEELLSTIVCNYKNDCGANCGYRDIGLQS